MTDAPSLSPATRAVRAAIATDLEHGAVVPPIHLSSTFAFEGFGRPRRFDYTRSGNPTRAHLAEALAQLEGGAGAVVTSTGMSAVTLVLQLLKPGDLIVAAHDCYGGTQRLLRALAKRGHFDVLFADLTDTDRASALIAAAPPRLLWIETPSNPLLRITDVRRLAACARTARGAAETVVVVDNTFLSPALQQPIALGADVVVHSTTKYLNGHSDVVGGAVVAADSALAKELDWWANCLGITGAPFDSYLTLRGLRTLHARMRSHLEGAAAVVATLRSHPAVQRVYYPGLETHPGHALACEQQQGFGAMASFEVAGGPAAVELLARRLRCFTLAESLGGVESLIAHPATMTHASMDPEARAAAGISDALVRLSVGIEHPDDLANDLRQALDAVTDLSLPEHSSIPVSSPSPDATDLVLLGAGAIGRELIAQLTARSGALPFRVSALIDRSGYVFAEGGFTVKRLRELSAAKAAGHPLAESVGGHSASALRAMDEITRHRLRRPIVVDVSAAETTDVLHLALARGCDLVLANKLPLAGGQEAVDLLDAAARRAGRSILHEATVGAGLPVLDTIEKLLDSGDDVLAIEGCPSGTLGFLFAELARGTPFSAALRAAMARGYAEPDPRVDLTGGDVARKALILARAIGFRGEPGDVAVESLVPPALAGVPFEEFLARLDSLDAVWAARVVEARIGGHVLRYRVRVTPSSLECGVVAVLPTAPLGVLDDTDNQFTFTTARYSARPLVISGPGAGAGVTAAGVVNDLIRLERRGVVDSRTGRRFRGGRLPRCAP